MSVDIYLTRSNHKIAYGLILQHINFLKNSNYQGEIRANEVADNLQIPYRTVIEVFNQLNSEQVIKINNSI